MTVTTTPQLGRPAMSRRRQHYIKGSFQRRFIVQFCAIVIMGCVALGLILYGYSTRTLTTAFVDSKLRVVSTAEFLLPALVFATVLITAVVAIAVAVRLLFFSHRIAGPLYRLEKTAEAIGHGDLSGELRLRAGDELQGVAHSMDGMVTELRTRVTQIQAQTRRLQELIAQAKQQSDAPAEFLQALEETEDRLDGAISQFRV